MNVWITTKISCHGMEDYNISLVAVCKTKRVAQDIRLHMMAHNEDIGATFSLQGVEVLEKAEEFTGEMK